MTKREKLKAKNRDKETPFWLNCITFLSPSIIYPFYERHFQLRWCVCHGYVSDGQCKIDFVKSFSSHVERVNDKKREALLPIPSPSSQHLTFCLNNLSVLWQVSHFLAGWALVSSLHIHKHLNQMLKGFIFKTALQTTFHLQFFQLFL